MKKDLTRAEEVAIGKLNRYYQPYMRQWGKEYVAGHGAAVWPPQIFAAYDHPTATTSQAAARYSMVRKICVVADRITLQEDLTEQQNQYFRIHTIDLDDDLVGNVSYHYFIRCLDVVELARWLEDTRRLIDANRLSYVPDLVQVHKDGDYSKAITTNVFQPDLSLSKFRISETIPAFIDNREYQPLFSIDLPYIENLDLDTLGKLLEDHPEQACVFQGYMKNALCELNALSGTTNMAGALNKVQRDLTEGSRIASVRYESLQTTSALRVTSAVVTTMSFLVYSLFCDGPGVVKVLGPGGGVALLVKEIADLIQSKNSLKENCFYFLAIAKSYRDRPPLSRCDLPGPGTFS